MSKDKSVPKAGWYFLKKVPGGHKFFRNGDDGRIAIADDSGETPSWTDDGVLYLDHNHEIIAEKQDGERLSFSFALQATEWGGILYAGGSFEEALFVQEFTKQPILLRLRDRNGDVRRTIEIRGHEVIKG